MISTGLLWLRAKSATTVGRERDVARSATERQDWQAPPEPPDELFRLGQVKLLEWRADGLGVYPAPGPDEPLGTNNTKEFKPWRVEYQPYLKTVEVNGRALYDHLGNPLYDKYGNRLHEKVHKKVVGGTHASVYFDASLHYERDHGVMLHYYAVVNFRRGTGSSEWKFVTLSQYGRALSEQQLPAGEYFLDTPHTD